MPAAATVHDPLAWRLRLAGIVLGALALLLVVAAVLDPTPPRLLACLLPLVGAWLVVRAASTVALRSQVVLLLLGAGCWVVGGVLVGVLPT